ncbi:MAG: dynamin family protein, partial [Streptomyces sp.]|nr:dynamin family protein [Streptomyces sp.]
MDTDHQPDPAAAAFEALRHDVLGLFPDLTEQARRLGGTETLTRLDTARQRLTDGRLTVLVCGEFNRGKSTLINALLEDPGALIPVGTTYTTNVVTTITHAPRERITATVEHLDGSVEEREIERAEIARYGSENDAAPTGGPRSLALRIETPNPRLTGGLVLVDTPGVGGVHREHTAATAAFLPSADALLFVTDVVKPLTDSELAFLRRAMKAAHTLDHPGGQIFVLNKTDLLPDHEELLRNTVEKVASTTGFPPEELTVVAVSAQSMLDHLTTGDPEDLELSNVSALRATLWRALARRRAQLLLGGALSALDAAAHALARPLEAEAAALGEHDQTELRRLTERIEEQQRRLAD